MKTSNLTKWAALLAVVGGMAATVNAEYFIVSVDGTTANDTTFTGSNLTLIGDTSGASFGHAVSATGGGITNLTNSTLKVASSSFGGKAAYVTNYSTLILNGGTVTTSDNDQGISIGDLSSNASATLIATDVTINVSTGLMLVDATAILNGSTITTTREGYTGILALSSGLGTSNISGTLSATNVTVSTTSNTSPGLTLLHYDATITGANISTQGHEAHGLLLAASSTGILAGGTISTSGNNAYGIYVSNTGFDAAVSSTLTAINATVKTSGESAHGISVIGNNTFTSTNVNVSTTGNDSYGYNIDNATATLTGGTITTAGDSAFGLLAFSSALTITNARISTTGSVSESMPIAAAGIIMLDSSVTLTGGTISTTGDASHGIIGGVFSTLNAANAAN
jgi:autotransporter family porin